MDSARKKLKLKSNEELNVFFQDEGRFGRMARPVSCWAKKGTRPNLPVAQIREYTYAYSAVSPQNGELFSLVLPYADVKVMEIFLREFCKHINNKPTLMIMDQAAWHTSEKLNLPPNLILAFQPPYSPELNPVECLWKYIREKFTHNKFWQSMTELEDDLCDALRACSKMPKTIKSLSNFRWINL